MKDFLVSISAILSLIIFSSNVLNYFQISFVIFFGTILDYYLGDLKYKKVWIGDSIKTGSSNNW